MEENLLTTGIEAAKRGDLEKARSYLARAVQENPQSEEGWLWLGRCLAEKDQRKYCYEKVLRLNPQNAEAQREMDDLFLSDLTIKHSPAVENEKQPSPTPDGKEKKADWKSNPAFLTVMGVISGLCICGVPLIFLIYSGLLDPLLSFIPNQNAAPSPDVFLSATPYTTASPYFTETPYFDESNVILPTLTKPAVGVDNTLWQVRDLVSREQYAQAIPLLDPIIQAAPELDEPYYLRALSYQRMLKKQRSQVEFEDYLNQALADIDQAIAIHPDQGDYYMLRQYLLVDLASNQPYRVDAQHILEYARENAAAALNLGSTLDEYPDRLYVTDLIFTNRCEEAVQKLQEMIDQTDPANSSIGGLYHMQSQAYMCLGEVNKALKMLDKSMFNNVNMEFKYELKARYLYQAGRTDEALKLLNELIDQKPSYGGWRYYLRALIYQEKGDRQKAENDLMMGAGNTWSHTGLFSYVEGKMALEDGDIERGVALLQEAEASLDYLFVPLQKRIQGELKELNAEPLMITPSVMLNVTSIPTMQARPTARPLQIPTLITSSLATPTATSQSGTSLPFNVDEAVVVDLATGTGELTLLSNDYPLLRFQPAEPISVKDVKSLVVHLIPSSNETSKPDIQIYFWVPEGGGWRYIEPTWGDNPVEHAGDYVLPEGDIFLAVRNWGTDTVTFDNVAVTLVAETEDGAIKTYGQK